MPVTFGMARRANPLSRLSARIRRAAWEAGTSLSYRSTWWTRWSIPGCSRSVTGRRICLMLSLRVINISLPISFDRPLRLGYAGNMQTQSALQEARFAWMPCRIRAEWRFWEHG
ncbi:hypothetical protein BTHE_1984 [Bifidobacterium thermophilum]|nr:hypothetical protein BTHE_1984 [Bifidobacterium thermophilum]